jgi:hypothetical protein
MELPLLILGLVRAIPYHVVTESQALWFCGLVWFGEVPSQPFQFLRRKHSSTVIIAE